MNASTRILGMLVWLGSLAVAGTVVLMLTAARVGEHKSSTYGNAYTKFQNITKTPKNMRMWRKTSGSLSYRNL